MTDLSDMTQQRWNAMSPAQRDAARDNSGLSTQLKGCEGWRVEVLDIGDTKPRRFIVGKSTGWRPCHLELANARSSGGGSASREYAKVRLVEKVR
jgi:hypothetical protein